MAGVALYQRGRLNGKRVSQPVDALWRATGFARWEPSRARGSGHSAFRKRKYLRTKSPSRPGSGASQTRQGTLTINGLWSSLGSDKVIKRIAIRALYPWPTPPFFVILYPLSPLGTKANVNPYVTVPAASQYWPRCAALHRA